MATATLPVSQSFQISEIDQKIKNLKRMLRIISGLRGNLSEIQRQRRLITAGRRMEKMAAQISDMKETVLTYSTLEEFDLEMRDISKLIETLKWDAIVKANITSLEAERQELAS